MMLVACQGGKAFANSDVCLVRGMSRPIGALYHAPHEFSNALLFAAVMEFSVRGARNVTQPFRAPWDLQRRGFR